MKIRQKLLLAFLAITIISGGVTGFFSINIGQKTLKRELGKDSVIVATEMLDKIDREICRRIERIEIYSEYLGEKCREECVISNQEFEKLSNIQDYIDKKDKTWMAAAKETITPFMQELIDNRLAEDIREDLAAGEFYQQRYGYSVYAEVFLTNKYGANIAQTHKTTDYYQADETWWQRSKEDGLYIEDFEYDEDAGVYSLAVGLRIDDESGNFLGVMKAVLNIQDVISIIKETEVFSRFKATKFKLITKDGKFIYSTEEELKYMPHRLLSLLKQKRFHGDYFIAKGDSPGEKEELFAYAHSSGYRGYKGLGWILIVEHETEEIFAPVMRLRNTLLVIILAAAGLVILISFFIAHSISVPIAKLRDTAREIGTGKLDAKIDIKSKDEIGDLAVSFSKMAESLSGAMEKEKKLAAAATATAESEKKKTEELANLNEELRQTNEELESTTEELRVAIEKAQKAKEKIQASLKEKEMLIREIHHRVKNNLQVISSLLRLQSQTITSKESIEIFRECQDRVKSMSLLHEKLYRSRDLLNIDFAEYVRELAEGLAQSYGIDSSKVTLKTNIKNISPGIDLAIPCGLLINELISNSLKHAFPKGKSGEVKVSMRPVEKGWVELIISDNGVGFPKELDFRKTKSLCLQLVNTLVKDQLGGEIELDRSAGTKFKIKLKQNG